MDRVKRIALVAHDNCKKDLVEWVDWNRDTLLSHRLICTGTTGKLVNETLKESGQAKHHHKIKMLRLKSGPFGGDQQLGAKIAEGGVDILIFFWDPMEPQPHEVDVKALLRIAVLYNIPTACNRSTADFLISSHLIKDEYNQAPPRDYSEYLNRKVEI
ncbi:MAG TPA: methylglyoxal synthase [Bacteroidota bacterium]|nr:methylglyoxal synthase [Bacteroidota bacterium]